MTDAATEPSPRRAALVLGTIAALLLLLVGRTAYLQTTFAAEMADRADRQHDATAAVAARRGGIFDRNGLLLAGTVEGRGVFVDPKFMHDQAAADGRSLYDLDVGIERLALAAHADVDRVALSVTGDPDQRYVPLARGLGEAQADRVVDLAKSLGLRGVATEPQPRRLYPMGTTAAHVLGSVGRDGQGLEGVEYLEDERLTGTAGRVTTLRDKRRRPIAAGRFGFAPPRHGAGLVLTIDAQIQSIAEKELAATVAAFGAAGGSVVVLDPFSGDVLAMASYPTFYPEFLADSTADDRRNRAVVDPHEPGSVVKPFLLAGLLERGVVRLDETADLKWGTRRLEVGRVVRDDYGYEKLSAWDWIVKSSNIGMSLAASRVTYDDVLDIYEGFGLGDKTGVEATGEHPGLLYDPPPDKYTHSSVSFGYAMLATPVQLARAMCAFANGGRLVDPRLVAGAVRPDGSLDLDVRPGVNRVAVREDVADTMRRVLADVFARGTARVARVETYNLFGKTGTTHKSEGGQQSDTKYTASFVGGGPYESPRLVIAVTIDEPDKARGHHGGQVAATTAARILEQGLLHLGTPLSPPLPEPPEAVREVLHAYYGPKVYEMKRLLTDAPAQDTNAAVEAREAARGED